MAISCKFDEYPAAMTLLRKWSSYVSLIWTGGASASGAWPVWFGCRSRWWRGHQSGFSWTRKEAMGSSVANKNCGASSGLVKTISARSWRGTNTKSAWKRTWNPRMSFWPLGGFGSRWQVFVETSSWNWSVEKQTLNSSKPPYVLATSVWRIWIEAKLYMLVSCGCLTMIQNDITVMVFVVYVAVCWNLCPSFPHEPKDITTSGLLWCDIPFFQVLKNAV